MPMPTSASFAKPTSFLRKRMKGNFAGPENPTFNIPSPSPES